MNNEESLKEFMKSHGIQGVNLHFTESCHTVEAAARAVNTTPDKLVKNICLLDAEGRLLVAIVKGEDRVSRTRVGKYLASAEGVTSTEPPRVATAEEILEKTGYPCGGVPSFGFSARFLIDPKVMEEEIIYTGGGSEYALIKMASSELLRFHTEHQSGRVVRIRR